MRLTLTSFLLVAGAAALVITGCDASITEGCLGGVCDQGVGGSSGATTTTTTGTGGEGGAMPPPKVGDYPCEVFAIIHQKCTPCHQDPPLNGAPFSLLTYEDTQQPYGSKGKIRYERMAEVIAKASGPFMPLMPNKVGVTALDPDQLTLLSDWLAAPTAVDEGMGCECPGTGCD